MDEKLKLLEKLSLVFGPSGCENDVADVIEEEIRPYVKDIRRDKIGNLIAFVPGRSSEKKLMISAHMDEVGFMISDITESGMLRFEAIGIDPRVLCGKNVSIKPLGHGRSQLVKGIIASKAIHLMEKDDREKATPVSKMLIDIGARSREEAAELVSVGDYATFDAPFFLFGEDDRMICAKAIDDRAGCSAQCEIIKTLATENIVPAFDTYFAFTTREETGISGARSAAYAIDPDYAIVLESTAIGDIQDAPSEMKVAFCGKGPTISLMDRGTVYPPEFTSFAYSLAEKAGIKCQYKQYVSGGNDAAKIHKVRDGVRTLALSLPCRYLHTPSNVIDSRDYYEIIRLALEITKKMETV